MLNIIHPRKNFLKSDVPKSKITKMNKNLVYNIAKFLDSLTIEQLGLLNKEFHQYVNPGLWGSLLNGINVPENLREFSNMEIYFTLNLHQLSSLEIVKVRRRLNSKNPESGFRAFILPTRSFEKLPVTIDRLEKRFGLPELRYMDLIIIVNENNIVLSLLVDYIGGGLNLHVSGDTYKTLTGEYSDILTLGEFIDVYGLSKYTIKPYTDKLKFTIPEDSPRRRIN